MTCNHNYVPTDSQWMRCTECGQLKPLNTMKKLLFSLLIGLVTNASGDYRQNVDIFKNMLKNVAP